MTLRDNAIRAYGAACSLLSRSALLYGTGFVGNVAVPRSVDHAVAAPLDRAVVVNLLLGLSVVCARWSARFMAQPTARGTHLVFGSVTLLLLYWQWRTLPAVIWDLPSPAGRLELRVVFWLGWAIIVTGAISIRRFDWFDLRLKYFMWRERLHNEPGFNSQLLYRLTQHPIMLGLVIAFWATPVMTAGHLLFAVAATGYVMVVVRQKERDLRRQSALTTTVIAELSRTVFPALRQATVFPTPRRSAPRPK
jgi:methanethiol S-methyltransferase